MALVRCFACEAPVSFEAAACPKCGHPIRKREPKPNPPKYTALEWMGSLCQAFGYIGGIIALTLFVSGIILLTGIIRREDSVMLLPILGASAAAIGVQSFGLLVFGALLNCIRDIARNSFR